MRSGTLFVLLACGCATSGSDKMSWRDAMWSAKPEVVKPTLKSDPAFSAELSAFIDQAQAARRGSDGAAMPPAQVDAWKSLLASVDAFLQRSPTRTALIDLGRARIVVESELELDAATYGDIPADTAAAVQGAVTRIVGRINEVVSVARKPKVTPKQFSWPVSPVMVSSPFGDRRHPLSGTWKLHKGCDIVAEHGQPVKAAYAGTVVFSGWNGNHGKQVHLVHDGRWATVYSHLSIWQVESGETVQKGQIIGFAGSTGSSTGPHVHFELLHEGVPVDPESELPPPPTFWSASLLPHERPDRPLATPRSLSLRPLALLP